MSFGRYLNLSFIATIHFTFFTCTASLSTLKCLVIPLFTPSTARNAYSLIKVYRLIIINEYSNHPHVCFYSSSIDSTTCRDGPCYPGVECTDIIDFRATDIELTPNGAVKQFRCGKCPDGFLGTGEACARK